MTQDNNPKFTLEEVQLGCKIKHSKLIKMDTDVLNIMEKMK